MAQNVSEQNFSMLPRNHSCDILGKNMAAFCLRSLSEAKVKRFWWGFFCLFVFCCCFVLFCFFVLIPLVEESSKKPSIIVLTLMKIHNEKEQAKEEKYLRRKGTQVMWNFPLYAMNALLPLLNKDTALAYIRAEYN